MLKDMNTLTKSAIYAAYPLIWYLTKDVVHGAQTSIFCAAAPELEKLGGKFYSDCKERKPLPLANDLDLSQELWRLSEELVGTTFCHKE